MAKRPSTDLAIKFRKERPKPLDETPPADPPPAFDIPMREPSASSMAGRLVEDHGPYHFARAFLWGAASGLLPISHGAGCGAFIEGDSSNYAEDYEGIDRFSTLHLSTNLQADDVRFGSDLKLAKAIDEAAVLFPLHQGMAVFAEDLAGLLGADFHGTARLKSVDLQKPVIPLLSEGYRAGMGSLDRDTIIGLRVLATQNPIRLGLESEDNRYSVVLFCNRPGDHLVWEVRRLLIAIGLRVEAQWSIGASAAELGRMPRAKLGICFSRGQIDEPVPGHRHPYAEDLRLRSNIPWIWTFFLTPESTATSLRAIASRFDDEIQANAEAVIAEHQAQLEPFIARIRARLEGKLILTFAELPRIELDPFRLLGLRIGNANGWPSKSGVWRIPRKNCDYPSPREDQIESLLAESRPDAVIGLPWDEHQAKKRGVLALTAPFVFDQMRPGYWGYVGFVHFAAHLCQVLENGAAWRKLVKPPWKNESG